MWINLCLCLLFVQHGTSNQYVLGDCQIEGCDISEDWSSTKTTESGDGMLHGPFGNETPSISRTFSDLEEHKGLQLNMRLWIADSWDTESVSVAVDGVIIFSVTYYFGNPDSEGCAGIGFVQAGEGIYPSESSYQKCYQDLSVFIPHRSNSVTVVIQSTISGPVTDESWAFNSFALRLQISGAMWGSFTTFSAASSLNTAMGSHRSLANIVEYHGGYIIEPTDIITTEYLEKIDLFFTSDLRRQITLHEQEALFSWVHSGGILIINARENYNVEGVLFSRMFGMGIYGFLDGLPRTITIEDESSHQFFQGVQELYFEDDSPFMVEDFVQIVLPFEDKFTTLAVLEDIGPGCGAVLTAGFNDLWLDGYIFLSDNHKFAKNVILWVHEKIDEPIDLWYPRVSVDDIAQCES